MGDINDLLAHSKKRGGAPHPNWLINGFCKVVTECDLFELRLLGGQFTWERARSIDAWIEEKFDRGFANQA